MFTAKRRTLIVVFCFIALAPYLYAQENNNPAKENPTPAKKEDIQDKSKLEKSPVVSPKEKENFCLLDLLNKKTYAAEINKEQEKQELRKKWEDLTGADIFYLYFKARDVEDWVKDKTKVKLFKMRGRLKLVDGEEDQIRYTFSIKF